MYIYIYEYMNIWIYIYIYSTYIHMYIYISLPEPKSSWTPMFKSSCWPAEKSFFFGRWDVGGDHHGQDVDHAVRLAPRYRTGKTWGKTLGKTLINRGSWLGKSLVVYGNIWMIPCKWRFEWKNQLLSSIVGNNYCTCRMEHPFIINYIIKYYKNQLLSSIENGT